MPKKGKGGDGVGGGGAANGRRGGELAPGDTREMQRRKTQTRGPDKGPAINGCLPSATPPPGPPVTAVQPGKCLTLSQDPPGNSQQRTSIHPHGNARRPGLLTTLPAGSHGLKHPQILVGKLKTTHLPPPGTPRLSESLPQKLIQLSCRRYPETPLKHPDANDTLNHQNSPGREPRLARIRRSRPLAGAQQEGCTTEAEGSSI